MTSTQEHRHSDLGIAADPSAELDRQIETLLDRGYAEEAGLSAAELRLRVEALRPLLPPAGEGEGIPFVVVVRSTLVPTVADTLNVRPNDALPMVLARGRTPLTTDEGVAVVTHFPEVLKVRNAFQALGSRADNKRIPSFWVSKGAPRLGWCWAGNPHTWFGAASAAARAA